MKVIKISLRKYPLKIQYLKKDTFDNTFQIDINLNNKQINKTKY